MLHSKTFLAFYLSILLKHLGLFAHKQGARKWACIVKKEIVYSVPLSLRCCVRSINWCTHRSSRMAALCAIRCFPPPYYAWYHPIWSANRSKNMMAWLYFTRQWVWIRFIYYYYFIYNRENQQLNCTFVADCEDIESLKNFPMSSRYASYQSFSSVERIELIYF